MSPQAFGVPDLGSKADRLYGAHFSADGLCSEFPDYLPFFVFLCLHGLMCFFRSEFSTRVTLVLMQWFCVTFFPLGWILFSALPLVSVASHFRIFVCSSRLHLKKKSHQNSVHSAQLTAFPLGSEDVDV